MASNEHLEKLIFEVHGAEKGAELIEKLREQEDKYAKSLKGLKKEAKERAKAEEDAAAKVVAAKQKEAKAEQDASQGRVKAMGNMKTAALGLAAGLAAAVKVGAEMVQTYARVDAANGRLKFSLQQTGMAAHMVDAAMRQARSQFKEWEQFGVSVEQQSEAMRTLVTESGNYEQSLADVKLAIDVHNAAGLDMQRAAEVVRKVRQGEVEVLKELGILTKDEAEKLGKVEDQSKRTAQALAKLNEKFGGGGAGTSGLEQSLNATNAKLEDTKRIMGELLVTLGEEGTGLLGSMAEFMGIIDEGEHPLDAVNDRLETLLDHAQNGNWQKLAGVLLMTNPATFTAGAAMLGVASSDVTSRTDTARGRAELTGEAIAMAGFRGTGNQVSEVPEPDAVAMSGGKPKAKHKRDPNRGSDALTGAAAPTDAEVWGAIWEEAYGRDIEAYRLAQEAKREAYNETLRVEAEGRQYLADLERKTQAMRDEVEQKQQTAQQKTADAIWAAAEASAGLAKFFIKGEGAKAVIEGGMQTAYAIAAGAKGNIAGAIGHGSAAAQFFAVAAQAGSGGKKGKGGGGRGGSSPSLSSDRERVSLMNEQNKSREARAPQTHVVNIYSTFGPSPQQSRELVDAVEREMRNRTTTRRM